MTDIMIDPNYHDFWMSDKRIRILRGRTRASGKSRNAALMCALTAMNGNNVLCLMKRRATLRDCVMSDIRWALDYIRPKSIHRVNLNRMEIELDTGYRILFRSWDDNIDYITVPKGFIGMVWWEDCQDISLDALMDLIRTAPSMRRATHVCTGRLFRDHPTWLNTVESNDFIDVFDKSYKDNAYLSMEDIIRMDNTPEESEMNMKDVYEFGTKVPVTMTYQTLDPHDIGWAVRCLKNGLKVSRKGWNGKGMFLWMLPAQELKMEWLHDDVKKKLAEENGGTLKANATVCLYNAQHEVTTGWTPWIEDLLADDWIVIEDD